MLGQTIWFFSLKKLIFKWHSPILLSHTKRTQMHLNEHLIFTLVFFLLKKMEFNIHWEWVVFSLTGAGPYGF